MNGWRTSKARLRRLTGEALAVTVGQILGAVGTISSVRVLTEVLPPAAYGELALALTIAMLLQQVWTGPVGQSALRFFAAAVEASCVRVHLAAVWRLFTLGAFIASPLVIVVACLLAGSGKQHWAALLVLALVLTAVSGAGAIKDDLQTAARQRIIVALHLGLAPWLRMLLALAGISVLVPTSTAAMFGLVLAAAAVAVSQHRAYRRTCSQFRGSPMAADQVAMASWRNRVLDYAWPFAAWGLFSWAQTACERWSIAAFVSTEDVGKYTALYQIGFAPMLLFIQVVMQLLAPILFARSGDGADPERVARTVRGIDGVAVTGIGLVLLLVGAATAFHPRLAGLLLALPYRDISALLPVLVASGGAFAAGQFMALHLMSQGRPAAMLIPKIGSGLAALIMVTGGAAVAGVTGVALGGLIASMVYAAWMFQASRCVSAGNRPGEMHK